jgi:hypothetical protein
MNSLLLDVSVWDLVLGADGNIAVASPPYALAQDVASAIRTFLGECYFDVTIGVPYNTQILGHSPSLSVFEQLMVAAALTVPDVVSATCTITKVAKRQVTGQVVFTDDLGQTGTVGIGTIPSDRDG